MKHEKYYMATWMLVKDIGGTDSSKPLSAKFFQAKFHHP